MVAVDELLEIMATLRDPVRGCPWDRKQTLETIIPFTIEEVYEVLDAIQRGDLSDLREELGDLLFQIVFLSRITEEQGAFNFEAVVQTLKEKLVRRHPHVFGSARIDSDDELHKAWDGHKAQERAAKQALNGSEIAASTLDGVAKALPALLRAHKLQSRAAKVGFDWADIHGVVEKLQEELEELRQELLVDDPVTARIEAEIGDVLFTCVNAARHLKIDAEAALRAANARFEQRFRKMEEIRGPGSLALNELTPTEWDQLWRAAKRLTNDAVACGGRDVSPP